MHAYVDPVRCRIAQRARKVPSDLVGGKDVTLHMDVAAGFGDIREHGRVQFFAFNEQRKRPVTRFRWVKAPTSAELTQLAYTIAYRVGRYLERQGLLERDAENSYLTPDAVEDDPMNPLLEHSITYRITVGPQAGRKVFTLQALLACDPVDQFGDTVGKAAGFSLHAGMAARAKEREKLECLCRYISRPAVSEKRFSLVSNGNIRYQLKTPYRDSTTHVIFELLDFIDRLAVLVPKPRVNLTRFHGVFTPNSKHRALVTPAKRGKGNKRLAHAEAEASTPVERHGAMTWAQRLNRVFTKSRRPEATSISRPALNAAVLSR